MDINISKSNDLPNEFYIALDKWKQLFYESLKNEKISWFSKLVETNFKYNDKYYKVTIYDICEEKTLKSCPVNYLEAILEAMQNVISDDLRELGATNIRNFGFLD